MKKNISIAAFLLLAVISFSQNQENIFWKINGKDTITADDAYSYNVEIDTKKIKNFKKIKIIEDTMIHIIGSEKHLMVLPVPMPLSPNPTNENVFESARITPGQEGTMIFKLLIINKNDTFRTSKTVVVMPRDTTLNNTDKIYERTTLDVQSEFPGGDMDLYEYVSKNLEYPKEAKKIKGKVFVKFVIEKDGSISNIEVIKFPEGGQALADEVIRVVKSMPKWKPGEIKGKPVRSNFILPVNFK